MLLPLLSLTLGSLEHNASCFDCSVLGPLPTTSSHQSAPSSAPITKHPKERHLKNIRQLTFGGQNAEAYWSADGKWITYQTRQPEFPDEQIFIMRADGSMKSKVSTGLGRCTCSYFTPKRDWVYFSSTHERQPGAQPPLDMSKGYLWMVNPNFSLYRSRPDGSQLQKIIDKNGYIAETTIAPDGKYMVFTGNFDGDLEVYRSKLDGSNIKRLTNEVGYDGGPFISWDGKKIVYRRAPAETPEQIKEYQELRSQHLVKPGKLEVWMMDADGSNKRRVTNLGAASFAPFLHPNGRSIIFSSNFGDKRGREFELWMINADGSGLERITYERDFDGFPMFSRDGKKIVWASNRNGKVRGETNIFVADWVD